MIVPSVEGFRAAAEQYCTLAQSTQPLTSADVWVIRELLVRLIFHIPAVESHPHDTEYSVAHVDREEVQRAISRFGQLPVDFYRVVFDPHDFDEDEPVTGWLADDLADIYNELSVGLRCAIGGHLNDACFAWSISYKQHWSRHAVHALTAIELYRTDHGENISLQ